VTATGGSSPVPGNAVSPAAASTELAVPQGRASRIRLNGVSAARRKRENPPFATTTSRSRVLPACAPSAGPWYAREWGTHSNVDADETATVVAVRRPGGR
jgi:hypothetical protein